jgi:PncC family amidohydrolase
VPGASDVFLCGIVAYADRVKEASLAVSHELLQRDGAVSELVARAMAEGVRRNFGAGLAVSITGIAGPGGGTSAKPVGTVWFATADGHETAAARMVFGGGRSEVRARGAQAALRLLRKRLGDP